MAYKDSDELKDNERYPLGDYSFRIERSSVPGSNNDKIEAICTDKDGKNARKSIQVPSSTKFDAWYVEANETEASVYVLIQGAGDGHTSALDTSPIEQPIPGAMQIITNQGYVYTANEGAALMAVQTSLGIAVIPCGKPGATYTAEFPWGTGTTVIQNGANHTQFTYQEQTVHTCFDTIYYSSVSCQTVAGGTWNFGKKGQCAWTLVYGTPTTKEPKEMLIARFQIEIEDAGGVGPGSDWTDPGDYDDDWEPGDPTYTLYLTVTGALSGRHNDPIEDPSYSYIPADKDTVKGYGCGGDGGHGGGGGAGASTVVVHKFATNQANSKEVTAIARRHGYGSGGGKGGKGGDGCILVYY